MLVVDVDGVDFLAELFDVGVVLFVGYLDLAWKGGYDGFFKLKIYMAIYLLYKAKNQNC